MNWVFAGDSITHGVWHTAGQRTFSELFSDYLENHPLNGHDRSNDVVINTGISGATTADAAQNWDHWVSSKHGDVVFLAFGMNDGRTNPPAVPLNTYIENLRSDIAKVRANGGIPILQTQNYTGTASLNTNLDKLFAAERKLAEEEKVMLIDANRIFLDANEGNAVAATFRNDQLHPNKIGHLRWAKGLMNALGLLADDSRLATWQDADTTLLEGGKIINTSRLAWGNRKQPEMTGVLAGVGEENARYDGSSCQKQELDTEVMNALGEATLVSRVRIEPSSETVTLAAFSNSSGVSKVNVQVLNNGKMRVNRNFGTEDGFYTDYKSGVVLNDGSWHTVAVSMTASRMRMTVDGIIANDVDLSKNAAHSMAPSRFTADKFTVGCIVDSAHPEGAEKATGFINYAALLNHDSNIATLQELTTEANGNLLATVTPHLRIDGGSNWVFVGGATTEGNLKQGLAKNYVEAVDEAVRWEISRTYHANGRAKFFINTANDGQSIATVNRNYEQLVGRYAPNLVFINPDIRDAKGKAVETDVAKFSSDLNTLIAKIKEQGAKPILITPASVNSGDAAYAEEMYSLAKANDLPVIDAYAYFTQLNGLDSDVAKQWFNTRGQLNHHGHAQLAKYIMRQIKAVSANSNIMALNYIDPSLPIPPAEEPAEPDPSAEPTEPEPSEPAPSTEPSTPSVEPTESLPSTEPSDPAPSTEPSTPTPTTEPSNPAPSTEPTEPLPSTEPGMPTPSQQPTETAQTNPIKPTLTPTAKPELSKATQPATVNKQWGNGLAKTGINVPLIATLPLLLLGAGLVLRRQRRA